LAQRNAFSINQSLMALLPPTATPGRGGFTWRLETLARTEVGRALSEGTHAMLEVADRSITRLTKQWMRTGTSPGRTGHSAVDGTSVNVSERFAVAVERGEPPEYLRFPRDEAGSPRNCVNCSCFLVPALV